MLYKMVWQSYKSASYLYFNDDNLIKSKEGVQQGDPLGPFLFLLAIMDLTKRCESEINLWYLDDGTIAGPPETVYRDLNRILASADTLGLSVNPKKCELFTVTRTCEQQGDNAIPEPRESTKSVVEKIKRDCPRIKTPERKELLLLGAPILEEEIDGVLLEKLEDLKRMVERLSMIDAHDALFLLKNCFAIPKLTYFLRCAPTFKNTATLQLYDQEMRNSLQKILNVELKEEAFNQSSLPVKQGGLGVRMATDIALPAFLSSGYGSESTSRTLLPDYINTTDYQELTDARDLWSQMLNNNAWQPTNFTLQALWDAPLYVKKYQDLLNSATNPTEKARLWAVGAEQASAWLNAVPATSLGLKLDNMSLRIVCGLRLGSDLCQPYKCICGGLIDSSGRHGLSCKNAKGTHSRHQHVNDLLKRALGSAQVTAILEPAGLSRSDGKRPDGLTLFPWAQGKCVVWDFTCRDTLCQSNISVTSKGAGKVAEKAEDTKLSHYQELTTDYIVKPVAVETLGSWGPLGLKFVKDIGQRIEDNSGEKRSRSFLFQAINMAVQRGNAASIRGSIPNAKSLSEIFYL